MTYIETSISGVWIIEPKVFNDERGYFMEAFKQKEFDSHIGKTLFIQDNEPFILIQEYYLLYLERCEIFSKSNHIFDEELEVQKKISEFQLYEGEKLLNHWQFVKSHENIYVQISDMVAGLLRRLFMFLDTNSIEKMFSISSSLNDKQITNFKVLWDLLSKSDDKSKLFIKNANTPKNIQERMKKLHILSVYR